MTVDWTYKSLIWNFLVSWWVLLCRNLTNFRNHYLVFTLSKFFSEDMLKKLQILPWNIFRNSNSSLQNVPVGWGKIRWRRHYPILKIISRISSTSCIKISVVLDWYLQTFCYEREYPSKLSEYNRLRNINENLYTYLQYWTCWRRLLLNIPIHTKKAPRNTSKNPSYYLHYKTLSSTYHFLQRYIYLLPLCEKFGIIYI